LVDREGAPLMLAALKHWKLIGLGLLCLLLAVQTVRLGHRSNQLERAKINLNECREGRKADREAYAQAQRDAKAKNEAEVSRIEKEQEQISAEAKSRYQRDLDRLRNGGLRQDLAAPKGSAGCATASADGKAASGVDGENVCVPRSLLVQAAEIELGRNALIDWINNQLKVAR
jgi:hypothetical protein